MVKCPDCKGTGGFFLFSDDPERCERCRGSGEVPVATLTEYEALEAEREDNLP